MRHAPLACLLTFACTAALAADQPPAGAQVVQKDRQFSPNTLIIAPGTVTFVNQDDVTHNVSITAPDGVALPSYEQNPGDTHSVDLTAQGTYKVTCLIHPKMKLSIQVKPAGK
jgi:cytochrome c peroxidase